MKFTIEGLSQYELLRLELDGHDAIILRWIIDFASTDAIKKREFNDKIYFWLKYSKVVKDLPILNLNNARTVSKRFKKYTECGLLENHIDRTKTGTYTYFRFIPEVYKRLINDERSKPMSPKSDMRMSPKSTPIDISINSNIDSKESNNGTADAAPSKKVFKTNKIIEHYNKLPNVQKHKNTSKTYNTSSTLIRHLKNGTFATYVKKRYNEFDTKWFKQKKITALLSKKFGETELFKMMENINDYIDKDFYPNWGGKSKPTLESMLFNSRTGRSLALWLFANPPKLGNKIVPSKYPDVELIYKKYAFSQINFNQDLERSFIISINQFCDKIEELFKTFEQYNYKLKIPDNIYEVHAKWAKANIDMKKFSFSAILSVSNGFWGQFDQYVQNFYKCSLRPNSEELEASMRLSETRKAEKKARYSSKRAKNKELAALEA